MFSRKCSCEYEVDRSSGNSISRISLFSHPQSSILTSNKERKKRREEEANYTAEISRYQNPCWTFVIQWISMIFVANKTLDKAQPEKHTNENTPTRLSHKYSTQTMTTF